MVKEDVKAMWFSNPKYYNSDNIRQIKADDGHSVDIALIYSGRNRGKSFDICARALLDAWDSQGDIQFGYCRRLDKEMRNYMVEDYFADKEPFIRDISDNKADTVICYNGALYFGHTVKKEGKKPTIEKLFKIGNTFALSISRQYKSLQYPKITRLLYEEVFTDGAYLPDEANKLLNLISTIQRGRDNFICYMISNTVSRVNPYVEGFGLSNMIKQKAGTIDTYKLFKNTYDPEGNEEYYFIACEYLHDAENEKGQPIKKKSAGTSVLSNKWDEARLYPTVSQKLIDTYATKYRAVFQNNAFQFYAQVKDVPINLQEYIQAVQDDEELPDLSDEYMEVLFITRKTTPYKYDVRLYTTQPIVFPLVTRGLIMLTDEDKLIMKLLEVGHCYYANNLIANEFSQSYRILRGVKGI